MSVLERRLEILKIMTVKRKSNVSKLAEKMGVSKRTIQRDIQALIAVAPLVCVSGNGGGPVTEEEYLSRQERYDGQLVELVGFTKEEVDVVKSVMTHSNEYEKSILMEMLREYASGYDPLKNT